MSLPPYDQSIRELERQYQVVLPDSVGQAALGFREGVWFRVNAGAPRPVPIRSAIILCPHAAGSIVQITCWWMRENGRTSRALDLATELSLCVGELARKAVEDDPLGMSLDSLSTSQQNAVSGFAGGLGTQPAATTYGASAPGVGGGFENPGYGSGAYQTAPDPYQPSAYPSPAPAAGATTVLPQIPADGYGVPPAQRGPAVPPRGAGGPAGRPVPLGSGSYPQRPAQQQQPLSGQPMRPQQPGGRYPQGGPGQGGRPQQRPVPRPEQRYEEDFRGDLPGRPPSRPSARPDQGGAW
jgi:hypothetical protein